jgi:hypothetical protein
LGRSDAGRSDEGRSTCRDAARHERRALRRTGGAGQSAFGHQISRRAAGWAVGRCQAGLGGESTRMDVATWEPSAPSATATQECQSPASSGGTGGIRPLFAEMSPSVQCASHSALLAEGSKASQSWPWPCRASLAAVTSAAGEPGRSRHSPCPANASWDQSSAAIARRTVRWNHFRWRRRAMTAAYPLPRRV